MRKKKRIELIRAQGSFLGISAKSGGREGKCTVGARWKSLDLLMSQ